MAAEVLRVTLSSDNVLARTECFRTLAFYLLQICQLFNINTSTARDNLAALGLEAIVETNLRILTWIRDLAPQALGKSASKAAMITGREARLLIARVHGKDIATSSGLGTMQGVMPAPPAATASPNKSSPVGMTTPILLGLNVLHGVMQSLASPRPGPSELPSALPNPRGPASAARTSSKRPDTPYSSKDILHKMGLSFSFSTSESEADSEETNSASEDVPFFKLKPANLPPPTYSTRPFVNQAPNWLRAPSSFFHNVTFPSELPNLDGISAATINMTRYGLPEAQVPLYAGHQISRFVAWCMAVINTDRSEAWTYAVQSTSIEKTEEAVRGYLGFCRNVLGIPEEDIGLELFAHPEKISKFITFLLTRGAGRDQVVKHIGIARKVSDFLKSGADESSNVAKHVLKLDKWLLTIQKQLYHEMPPPKPPVLPEGHLVRVWADAELENAWNARQTDLYKFGCMTRASAVLIQRACIVAFVVAHSFPTFRLDLIKNLMHPSFNDCGCQDPDCRDDFCLGNRISINDGTVWPSLEGKKVRYPTDGACSARPPRSSGEGQPASTSTSETFTIHVLHGKNDKRILKQAYQVSLTVPDGLLNKLLFIHARDGHALLTQGDGGQASQGRFFVNPARGQRFDDSGFSNWWKNMMERGGAVKTYGVSFFPPSRARNIFVISYRKHNEGEPSDVFEGAAAIMGNSPKQWDASYDMKKRQREADLMMRSFPQFVNRQSRVGEGASAVWE